MHFMYELARYNPWGFATVAGFFTIAVGAWVLDICERRAR